ncbi:MAG: hypothetical protein K0S54_2852 [Alphaproteobacteria bacterium]|jgi:hypothetical protein|nr:hypothetical protein [Alphaproteobacteria bacterium]
MLGFWFARRGLASLIFAALLALPVLAPTAASAQGVAPAKPVGSPIGIQTAYGGLNARPWFADQPDYFSPFDFQWGDGKSWFNAWAGAMADAELSDIVFGGDGSLGNVGLAGVSISREFGSLGNAIRFEWEVGATLFFGAETFASAQAYLITRWIWFPWNKWLMTTFAVGTGPSIATKKSKYEKEDGEASYYKNGFMVELTFNLPEHPNWVLQYRNQHRSSIFGVLPNAGSPSDSHNIGIKYRF